MNIKNKQPLISIVMPVYNAGQFLGAAIESIRKQTHKHWELIATDDGSNDNSLAILKSYAKKDKRIRIFKNNKNLGVTKTANLCLAKTNSKWIARMDADDLMHPRRLEIQLKTLKQHPSVVVIGSQCTLIDKDSKKIGKKLFPTCPKDIFNMLFWACPVQQPSIMVNAKKLPQNFRWYDPETKTGEEIRFLIRISKYGQIVNYRHSLLQYRIHNHNLSLNQNQKQVFYNLFKIRLQMVLKGQYQPAFTSLILGLFETLIVTLLPEKAILPTFQAIRGMRDVNLNFRLPTIFPALRTVHLSA